MLSQATVESIRDSVEKQLFELKAQLSTLVRDWGLGLYRIFVSDIDFNPDCPDIALGRQPPKMDTRSCSGVSPLPCNHLLWLTWPFVLFF